MAKSVLNNFGMGTYVQQQAGYRAFIPANLPLDPPLRLEGDLLMLLSEADRAIGRLDAATQLLPNPDLFVSMYIRREAVYSSQIEGTQASLADLLEYEADAAAKGIAPDVKEVVNYINALDFGLKRLDNLPLSLRLIREIHEKLLEGVRGGHMETGEFRTSQNWIGPGGSTIATANFVPPPPHELMRFMGNLELFLHDTSPIPPLIRCGMIHVQFETIHPFLDGNGRVGRLLITFWLYWKGILRRPLLYLSHYFKQNQAEYYDRLQKVRDRGEWAGWIRFFLEGVRTVATEAADTARQIQEMRESHRRLLVNQTGGVQVLDRLFTQPMVTVNQVEEAIAMTYPVAAKLVQVMEKQGLLLETTGRPRSRIYAYRPYLALLGEDPAARKATRGARTDAERSKTRYVAPRKAVRTQTSAGEKAK
jgi:Fic family protein